MISTATSALAVAVVVAAVVAVAVGRGTKPHNAHQQIRQANQMLLKKLSTQLRKMPIKLSWQVDVLPAQRLE